MPLQAYLGMHAEGELVRPISSIVRGMDVSVRVNSLRERHVTSFFRHLIYGTLFLSRQFEIR